jgi:class 3 adenylate cyclase
MSSSQFPNVTVLFADISGFTAWASVREPSQVFTLLEQIYGSFDAIANSRKVFKVETIGDCYVAAAGIPNPRDDHASLMVRFARDCLVQMNESVHALEVLLGPDTAELSMRFGLHSGPVTAGVLRGEKTRFQLFGDTVNTASRIESTGVPNRIHISTETANLLINAGKAHWVKRRKELVDMKGKGEIQTYFVEMDDRAGSRRGSKAGDVEEDLMNWNMGGHISHNSTRLTRLDNRKTQRLVDWNVEVLQGLLKKIVAMRDPSKRITTIKSQQDLVITTKPGATVLDEMKEIIVLPDKTAKYKQDPSTIELEPDVKSQLRDYVEQIAKMYRSNSFHSFDHASHVVQSVTKLLARVVTPDSIDYQEMTYKKQKKAKLHEYTYGVASSPITHFACAFSALIHDADHTGAPNAILIKADPAIASKYHNKSVAEQNSVDLAWNLLNQPKYMSLRACIYTDQEEMQRFRQLVVNSVMATDIADKDLGALRKARWEKAFKNDARSVTSNGTSIDSSNQDDVNRKATIVIEHLIQASDVSHTMQHWHVYLKWNERLFH